MIQTRDTRPVDGEKATIAVGNRPGRLKVNAAMRGPLRTAIIIGILAAGMASPVCAAGSAPAHPSIVWRLSGGGDWLVGLRSENETAPVALGPTSLKPAYADAELPASSARPAIVLRLEGQRTVEPPVACGLPFWLAIDDQRACARPPSAWAAGLSAALGWSGPAIEAELHAGTSTGPLPAKGSLAAAASAAGVRTPWPLLVAPPAAGSLAVERYGLDGRVRLGEHVGLRWSATIAHAEVTGPSLGLDPGFDQKALSIGLIRGAWSGGLTGRLTRPRPAAGASAEFGALDLEVAWLTPWDGEFSFGAENLILRDQDRKPAQPAARLLPDPPARTPFVRYRQDF